MKTSTFVSTAPTAADITALALDLLAASRQAEQPRLTVGLTSARRGEGRTGLATSLAQTLAGEMGQLTLLVELDFERPSLANYYNLSDRGGLHDLLLEKARFDDIVQKPSPGLAVLVAGVNGGPAASRLSAALLELDESGLAARLGQVPGAGSLVLLDLPPLLDSPFGLQSAGLADRLVLAVRANSTDERTVKAALAKLDEAGYRSRLSHSVLVGTSPRTPGWLSKWSF